jgi:hypothetical protein
MNTAVAERPQQNPTAETMEDVIAKGDLSKLTPEQSVVYYHEVCRSLGLNPLTQPFVFMTLKGKRILYARKDCTDQLRKLHGINIEIVNYTVTDGLLTVHVRAKDDSERVDEDFGVVSVTGLRGEEAANAMMKAITKAKRRVTLSIAGLGLDDPEGDIDEAQPFKNLTMRERPAPKPAAVEGHGSIRPKPEVAGEAARIDNEQTPAEQVQPPEPQRTAEHAHDQDEAEPHEVILHGDDWSSWANELAAYVRAASTVDVINEWAVRNADALDRFKRLEPIRHTKLIAIINHEIEKRTEGGT